jgi:hypothetical protein
VYQFLPVYFADVDQDYKLGFYLIQKGILIAAAETQRLKSLRAEGSRAVSSDHRKDGVIQALFKETNSDLL